VVSLPITPSLTSFARLQDMTRIATGAFGSVYKCSLADEKLNLAIKLMPVPKSIHDR
jgi:hypothetical protein